MSVWRFFYLAVGPISLCSRGVCDGGDIDWLVTISCFSSVVAGVTLMSSAEDPEDAADGPSKAESSKSDELLSGKASPENKIVINFGDISKSAF